MRKWFVLFVASAPALGVPSLLRAGAEYVITDLGTLGGTSSVATAINDRGEVVGSATTPQFVNGFPVEHAFRADRSGALVDLGTLGGNASRALGINNSGRVVGWSTTFYDPVIYSQPTAFRTDASGVMTNLGLSLSRESSANGINNLGEAVGLGYLSANSVGQGFRADPAGVLTYRPFGPGAAINDRGQVAGGRVVVDAAGVETAIATPGGNDARARAINNLGRVAGQYDTGEETPNVDDVYRAFVTDDKGVVHDLGTLGGVLSDALGINDAGTVVGESQFGSSTLPHAFVYDATGLRDLNGLIPADSGWTLLSARDVNNLGQIVGVGTSPQGFQRAFLLTPVPEPAAFALAAGLAAPLVLRRTGTARRGAVV